VGRRCPDLRRFRELTGITSRVSLAEGVREEVLARNGIALEFEIVFLGDWSGAATAPTAETPGDDAERRQAAESAT